MEPVVAEPVEARGQVEDVGAPVGQVVQAVRVPREEVEAAVVAPASGEIGGPAVGRVAAGQEVQDQLAA